MIACIQTIVYSFCNGDDIQKKKVETTIQKWAECVNLTFQLEHDPSKPSNIRISFENKGNWTKIVGRNEVAEIGSTTMNLGAVNSTSETITPSEQGVILHEWGHVLGLYHEHQVCVLYNLLVLCYNFTLLFSATRERDRVEEGSDNGALPLTLSKFLGQGPQGLGPYKYIQYAFSVQLRQI